MVLLWVAFQLLRGGVGFTRRPRGGDATEGVRDQMSLFGLRDDRLLTRAALL